MSVFRVLGERMGIFVSPEEQFRINNEFDRRLETEKKREALNGQLWRALAHSDACFSEIEHVLIGGRDPHPGHAIVWNPQYPPPDKTPGTLLEMMERK